MKHQYDGAMFTTIEIVWDDKKYKSAGFDDDNPPKELIPFFHYQLLWSNKKGSQMAAFFI